MGNSGDDSIVHVVVEHPERRAQLVALAQRTHGRARSHRRLEDFLLHDVQCMRGCLIVDVGPGCAHEIAVLWRAQPAVPVIVVSAPADVETAVEVMKEGAFDCFESTLIEEAGFAQALAAALRQNSENWQQVRRHAELRARLESLTARERQVMSLLARGTLNKIIASRLGLSRRTVETHRTNVMIKMQAQSVAQLINMSLRLDSPEPHRTSAVPVWRRYGASPPSENSQPA